MGRVPYFVHAVGVDDTTSSDHRQTVVEVTKRRIPMPFPINHNLLIQARTILSHRTGLLWIVGASGSGKSTVCRALAERFGLSVFDMDAHIYGDWHARFDPIRHPVNRAWAGVENGLGWLLDMSWAEFDAFNRAALPEYLDLLAQDLAFCGAQPIR